MENVRFMLLRIINIVFTSVGILISLRIILKFFGANAGTPIVSWIYAFTNGLVYPFQGMFQDIQVAGLVLEVSAIISFIAYTILAYIFIAIVNSLIHPLPQEHHHELGYH